jgi:hypothetical protein
MHYAHYAMHCYEFLCVCIYTTNQYTSMHQGTSPATGRWVEMRYSTCGGHVLPPKQPRRRRTCSPAPGSISAASRALMYRSSLAGSAPFARMIRCTRQVYSRLPVQERHAAWMAVAADSRAAAAAASREAMAAAFTPAAACVRCHTHA